MDDRSGDRRRRLPAPPSSIPARAPRARTQGDEDRVTFSVPLRVVTPILGGAATPRSLDDHDALRVPSVRGQLRFWWRCLHARGRDGASLHAAERSLWGGAAGAGGTDDGASRSPVEVSLVIHELSLIHI